MRVGLGPAPSFLTLCHHVHFYYSSHSQPDMFVRVDGLAILLVISTLASILLSIMRNTLWPHVDGGVVLMLGARNGPNSGWYLVKRQPFRAQGKIPWSKCNNAILSWHKVLLLFGLESDRMHTRS